jgi:hypothetical protein
MLFNIPAALDRSHACGGVAAARIVWTHLENALKLLLPPGDRSDSERNGRRLTTAALKACANLDEERRGH